jgi:hypothetical protein
MTHDFNIVMEVNLIQSTRHVSSLRRLETCKEARKELQGRFKERSPCMSAMK